MNNSAPYVQCIIPSKFASPSSIKNSPSPSARHNIFVSSFVFCLQVKAPQITHFELPFQIWTTASLVLLLIYTSSAPPPPSPDSAADSSHVTKFWWLARTLVPGIFPKWIIPPIWAFTFLVHGGEGAYMATLVRKHHMPWHIAVSSLCNGAWGAIVLRVCVAAVPDIPIPCRWFGSAQPRYLASPS